MKHLGLILASLAASSCLWALQPAMTIPLYPSGAPDSNGYLPADEYVGKNGGIYQTSEPRIDFYRAEHPKATLLVCPGGGYRYTSVGNEGIRVAEFFVPRGYNIAVLKYRLPNGHEHIPLEDASRAMELLRDSIEAWHLPSAQLGVMGFSAGGHLAASLLTKYPSPEARPDYGILVYPVISMDSTITHQGSCRQLLGEHPADEQRLLWSAEKQVTAHTPPCLIVACQDDPTVQVENSIRFYQSLTAAHVPASMMFVPVGKHGWGFSRSFPQRELIERGMLSFLAQFHPVDVLEPEYKRDARRNDWANFGRYAKDNEQIKAARSKTKVVFYGNSITQGWYKMRPDFFLSNGFVGRGISGQTSSELLVRFRQDVIDLHPKTVVILCGINDIAENNGTISLEHTMGNIISMCELAKANKIRPVLCSVLPARTCRWNPFVIDVPQQVIALNALIKAYADASHIRYVDYYSAMADSDGGLKQGLSNDDVHPTVSGYEIMEPIVLKALK
ncbi:MAG: alpha/beta hydrolase fold domain-containing protein [Paludibacteraceae bacterium]|nr:alpha/beta hydrolase fold domain-containing protein [Paludibacteraceae bacterium]